MIPTQTIRNPGVPRRPCEIRASDGFGPLHAAFPQAHGGNPLGVFCLFRRAALRAAEPKSKSHGELCPPASALPIVSE